MSFKVSEIAGINTRNLSKRDKIDYINYLDTANLTNGLFGEIKRLVPGEDVIPSRAQRKIEKNDILISTVRPNQKHYGIVKDAIPNFIASTGFAVLTPDMSKVNSDYLYYYLTQEHITEYLSKIAEDSTSAYPAVNPKVIGDLEINLPAIEEQTFIADLLAALSKKIELNNCINKTLEEMAQALFKQWFVDFEFPDENGQPYKSSGGEMEESELGLIPKGWKVGRISDLCTVGAGKRPKVRQNSWSQECRYPIIGASSIMGYNDEYLLDDPIIVTGRVGTHGIVGRFDGKTWPSDNTLVITSEFYQFSYQNMLLVDYKSLNRGSTQPLITQSDIKNQPIYIPSSRFLNEYEFIAESIFGKQRALQFENENLTSLRDALLPKLMSGEIRVPIEEVATDV